MQFETAIDRQSSKLFRIAHPTNSFASSRLRVKSDWIPARERDSAALVLGGSLRWSSGHSVAVGYVYAGRKQQVRQPQGHADQRLLDVAVEHRVKRLGD